MEFLSDAQCCTKCLKKGIRVPYLEHRTHYSNGFDKRHGRGRRNNPMRWCRACWRERSRRNAETWKWKKQQRLRSQEWEARALMTKEERKRTPVVHIPMGRIFGPNKGKLRHPFNWLAIYSRYRNRAMRRLLGEPPLPRGGSRPTLDNLPKRRHNILPTS